MFEANSRYRNLETAQFTMPDGRVVAYVRRRFLPQGDTLPLLVDASVQQGDRLDMITARTIGDPEQFWRVADANNAMNPNDLTSEPGATLRAPIPQAGGNQ